MIVLPSTWRMRWTASKSSTSWRSSSILTHVKHEFAQETNYSLKLSQRGSWVSTICLPEQLLDQRLHYNLWQELTVRKDAGGAHRTREWRLWPSTGSCLPWYRLQKCQNNRDIWIRSMRKKLQCLGNRALTVSFVVLDLFLISRWNPVQRRRKEERLDIVSAICVSK
jgi:hypothetical protein